ncbi:hypothetical protein [Thalassoroseus pseudoceratinae]|uniref:hypothetical protein n=1 Tax=Thalassoroseus pseudoceratinae TaxID=2713176 RepID=UPI001422EF2B|nr:hypothetical protein [Thalassoroseus pseudoceratinae]
MKSSRFSFAIGTFAIALGFVMVDASQLHARPKYLAVFTKEYSGLKASIDKARCAVCHPTANNRKKKVRNDYGKALGKALGAANVSDTDKIKNALKKIESEKSESGKTFGDLIKAGKLPGTNKE